MGLGELFSGVQAASSTTSAFGGMTSGASIMTGSVGAAAAPSVGAGISVGSSTATAAGTGASWAGSLSHVATILTATGAIMGANSQMKAGDAAKDMADYNARVNELNAKMMDDEAKAARAASNYKVAQMAREHRRFLSFQKTRFADANVVSDVGSPLLDLNETVYLSAMDRFMTGYQGDLQVTELTNKANILRSNAGFMRYQGNIAQDTSRSVAASTLISGLGKVGSIYLDKRYRDSYGA